MHILIIGIGKLLITVLRLFGRNGSALPGLVVEKLYPKLLARQLDQIPEGVIIVTGTNGKTTTTKALVHLLNECGLRVLTNPTGSNFTRGVYATLVQYSKWTGGIDYDIAVLELDEAFSRIFARAYAPRYVLALNVMRDQLDRYGEIDTTADMIGETISMATHGVILNADDGRIKALATRTAVPVEYFGVSPALRELLPNDDEMHQSEKIERKHHKKKQTPVAVRLNDYRKGSATFRINGKEFRSELHVEGLHNASNITAALAATRVICPDVEPQFIVPAVGNIKSAFGRGELVTINGRSFTLALVKNPSGFRQSLRSYAEQDFDVVGFMINDNYADGRDISWLWDVDFTSISSQQKLITGGIRSSDMSLRLLYDDRDSISQDNSIEKALNTVIETTNKSALIYCTYTAMLDIRKILAKYTTLDDIW